jgi:hypothetical protein
VEVGLLSRLGAASLALVAVAACHNPDSVVYNGIPGDPSTPDAYIYDVGTAINVLFTSGTGTKQTQVSMFVLTDRGGVCTKLAAHPDYFKNPIEPFVALIMTTKANQLGTFAVGASNGATATFLVTPGAAGAVSGYSAVQGAVSVTQFGTTAGADSFGSFPELDFVDHANTLYYIYGKFKTENCPALANAQF